GPGMSVARRHRGWAAPRLERLDRQPVVRDAGGRSGFRRRRSRVAQRLSDWRCLAARQGSWDEWLELLVNHIRVKGPYRGCGGRENVGRQAQLDLPPGLGSRRGAVSLADEL